MNIKILINKSNNYQDLHNHLSKVSNKLKGDLFEEFCILVFKFHPYYKNNTKETYLLKNIPLNILNQLNLPQNDIGIDVIIVTNDNKYYAIQVKFRNNRNTNINYDELSTFVGTSFGIANNIDQAFYFSNTYPINKQIQRSKVVPIYGDFFDNLPDNFFLDLKNYFNNQNVNRILVTPRAYQQEIINITKEHFEKEDKAIIEMATGTGKTNTSYWIDKEMNNKLTIILVPSLYLLSQFYKSYCYQTTDEKVNCKFILVGSDADVQDENIGENVGLLLSTDPNKICNHISDDEKTFIISTYQSSDKLLESLRLYLLDVDLCIFDEAHKTVGNCDKKWNGMIITKDVMIKKKLFMTATPKVYNFNKKVNKKLVEEDIEEIKKEESEDEIEYMSDEESNYIAMEDNDYIEDIDEDNESYTEDNESYMVEESYEDEDNYSAAEESNTEDITEEEIIEEEDDDAQILSMCNEKIYGKLIYKYSIDRAIQEKYLNDYQLITAYTDNKYIEDYLNNKIYVRIKELDTTLNTEYLASALMILEVMNKKECNHLITYHNNIKNSKIFVKVLESLKNYYDIGNELEIFQLDGGNSMHARNKIINSFKAAEYAIIASCRTLCEGIDIPKVDSVCFCDSKNSCSVINVVQSVGRSLRLCEGKGISKILVPVILNSLEDDAKKFRDVIRILKCLKDSDNRIVEYFSGVDNKVGGFDLVKGYNFNSEIVLDEVGDLDIWREGVKIVLWNNVDGFEYKKNLLFEYCDKFNKVPETKIKYNDVNIGMWIHDIKKKIKCKENHIYKKLSYHNLLKLNLDKFLENKEKNSKEKLSFDEWKSLLFEYCDKNKELPKRNLMYKNKNINQWLSDQKKKIKTNNSIYEKLSENNLVKNNLDEYLVKYLISKNKKKLSFNESTGILFEYCNKFNKTPTQHTTYNTVNIGCWFQDQKKKIDNYENDIYIKLSINSIVKNHLDEYLKKCEKNKNKKKFNFNDSIKLLFEYCNEYKLVPKHNTVYRDVSIGKFLNNQKRLINSQDNEPYKKLSINKIIKNNLDEYLHKCKKNYKKKFNFDESMILLFQYCDENNKIPFQSEIYNNYSIGKWYCHQKQKICSINDEKYIKLSNHILVKNNLDLYLKRKKLKL